MRIARVLTRLNLGGPARQALAADTLLRERGHQVRLFAGTPEPGEGDLFTTFEARGLDVVRIRGLQRGISPVKDALVTRRLVRELEEFRPDVVHTHASKAGTLGRSALEKLTGSEGIARVHTFHGHVLEGYFPNVVSKRLIAHETRLGARTDRIVAVSHATADDLIRLGVVEEEKLVVIPPGIELDALLELPRPRAAGAEESALRRLLGAGAEEVLIGVVGRLAEVKRPELAIDVFAMIQERHPRAHLVFVGDGSERGALERRIRSLGELDQQRVHLLGAVEDMPATLAQLDLLLATSRSEGLPVALIEAAAAGLAVVATDVGGVGELVVPERTGFLGNDVQELAFALESLLGDAEGRRAMGERARLRIAGRHSATALTDRLEELYRVVCSERRATADEGRA